MTKYIVRKLDFGYLTKIKKKILYLNYFNRLIRFKNRKGLHLKKKFKIFINRVHLIRKLKHISNASFSNVLKPLFVLKTKFRFSNSIGKGFFYKFRCILLKKKYLLLNFIYIFSKHKFLINIKKKIKYFLKKKKQQIRHFLRRIVKRIKRIHNRRFRNKFVRLQLKTQIKKKFVRNFYKYKGKPSLVDILYLKSKYYRVNFRTNFVDRNITKFRPGSFLDKKKYVTPNKFSFKKSYKKQTRFQIKFNFIPRRKTQRQLRKEYLLKMLYKKTQRKLRSKRRSFIKFLICKLKLKIFNFNDIIFKFKSIFKYKTNLKLLSFTLKRYNKLRIFSSFQFSYLNLRIRKFKIKYYISKLYIVSNKHIKNKLFFSNFEFYFNIFASNLSKYSKIYNMSNSIKFLFNFILFYFFKFYNLNGLSRRKLLKKNKFVLNLDAFNLNRYAKNSNLNHIFETQNSFFFFRFIRLSKKILDLFLPFKNKLISNNFQLENKKSNSFYHTFILTVIPGKDVVSSFFEFNNLFSNKNRSINNIFFLILCKVIKKNGRIIINDFLC